MEYTFVITFVMMSALRARKKVNKNAYAAAKYRSVIVISRIGLVEKLVINCLSVEFTGVQINAIVENVVCVQMDYCDHAHAEKMWVKLHVLLT